MLMRGSGSEAITYFLTTSFQPSSLFFLPGLGLARLDLWDECLLGDRYLLFTSLVPNESS